MSKTANTYTYHNGLMVELDRDTDQMVVSALLSSLDKFVITGLARDKFNSGVLVINLITIGKTK